MIIIMMVLKVIMIVMIVIMIVMIIIMIIITVVMTTLKCIELFFPSKRVSNVSSMVCQFAINKCSDAVKAKFYNPNITMDELKNTINDFIE